MVFGNKRKQEEKLNGFSDETVKKIVEEFRKKNCGLYDITGIPSHKVKGFLHLEKMIGNNKDELILGHHYVPLSDSTKEKIPHMTFSAYLRYHYNTETFSSFILYSTVVAVFTPLEEHITYENFIKSIRTLKY